jgi:cardiolipin synthase
MAEIHTASGSAGRRLRSFFACATGLRPICAFLIAGALMGMQGCATLPDAKHEMAMPHDQQVEFESASGPVSAATSDAILVHLKGKGGASDVLQKHLAYEQALNADSPLVLGNKLTLLQNGPATYKAMFADMRKAKDHINLETYIFDDDEIGKQFSDLLLKRQASGVQVNIIHDSVGGIMTPTAFFDRLKASGINVLEFNPVNPLAGNRAGWLLNNRDHRRQLIIDGRIAYTGGINISATYSSAPSRQRGAKPGDPAPDSTAGWRDTHIRIEGPVVAEFQKLFMDTWARQKGEPLAPKNYFPKLKNKGDEIVRAIGSTPDGGSADEGRKPEAASLQDNASAVEGGVPKAAPQSQIYLTLMSAISHAESSVHLTIAYFAPDAQLLKALTDAAQRGVEVKLVLPSYSDSWAIFNLGRSYYTELLRGGVKIYERSGAVMHAKTACIDGVWSTIGSTNMDWRSFLHNDEINAVVLGRGFAHQMEVMFADDLKHSQEITLQQWKHRPWMSRVKEQMARIGEYWL